MTELNPKDFIKNCLIDELNIMIEKHPYFSFIIIGIGIEFLGKCIDTSLANWNDGGSNAKFTKAIQTIPSLQKYDPYLRSHDLYRSFRCGLAHAVAPKPLITLSSKQEMEHMKIEAGRLNLKIEDLFQDFKAACEYVILQTYPPDDKMNKGFLQVPGDTFNAGTNIEGGITGSVDLNPPSKTPPFSGSTYDTR